MHVIYADDVDILDLGYLGEDQRTTVVFDFSDIWDEFPGGVISAYVTSPGDSESHPIILTVDQTEHTASWLVDVGELDVSGVGKIQLTYHRLPNVAKTKIWTTAIDTSITGGGLPHDRWEEFYDELSRLAATTTTNAQTASNAAASASQSASNASASESNAEAYKEAAEGYKEAAETAMSSASSSASEAQRAKAEALQAKSEAIEAKTKAEEAENGAISAKGLAVEASNTAIASANSASAYAESASQSKTSAESSARTASEAAGTATQASESAEGYSRSAEEESQKAQAAAGTYPYIGDNGHWYCFDKNTGSFVDTGIGAEGPQGEPGEDGDDAPQIDDEHATTTNPWSGSKVAAEISQLNNTKVNKSLIGDTPASEQTAAKLLVQEEVQTSLLDQAVDALITTLDTLYMLAPQAETMEDLIVNVEQSNGLLNDIYLAIKESEAV